ncbi:hypothetical protein [Halocatena marina]|uniref:hypothetical protein n=1 Tax=Halocatena marina TaxID=2934937 RepID=UPI00200DF4AD|nr:hypothetical protein [Halocatena marina]
MPMNREELGFALLFSLPVGAGITLAVIKTTGSRDTQLALVSGLITAFAIFLLVSVSVLNKPDIAE